MKLFFWICVVVAAILLVVSFISTPIKDVSAHVEVRVSDSHITIVYHDINTGDEQGLHTEMLQLSCDNIISTNYTNAGKTLSITYSPNANDTHVEKFSVDDKKQAKALCLRLRIFAEEDASQIHTSGLLCNASQEADFLFGRARQIQNLRRFASMKVVKTNC